MVSEEQDKKEEKEHVKQVLKCNGYTNWAMKIPSKKESRKNLNFAQKERKYTECFIRSFQEFLSVKVKISKTLTCNF